jgi:hypothetical protein
MNTHAIRLSSLGAFSVLAALFVLGLAAPASANGWLYGCGSAVPAAWGNGGRAIPFNPDQGNLGPVAHDAAVELVTAAFRVWEAVPTSTASFVDAGLLPADVDLHNFLPYLLAETPDALNPVIFDDTGEIFDLLFGADSGILGFAGPEWFRIDTCEILEGAAFLNGPAFDDPTYAMDVMVHEFGHYVNLAHTVVNGQLFLGDESGPTPYDTFGRPPTVAVVETMYPFYFGTGSGSASLAADDVTSLSALYPQAGYFAATGSIHGTIYSRDGTTRLSGVNVIARNVADPFDDAVSAISGDRTFSGAPQSDPLVGTYALYGLTPGATYAVYVDQIFAGAFSTDPIAVPGPEEFHSGIAESNNLAVADPPTDFSGIRVAAGTPVTGVDVVLNWPRSGDPFPIGDDGALEVPLPFVFSYCGIDYDKVWINGNGNLTFEVGDRIASANTLLFLSGRPRIAALWTDLNLERGGSVVWTQTANEFAVTFTDVPEYPNRGANTFRITLHRSSNQIDIDYGQLTATGGLAGLTCGRRATSGFEGESDLSKLAVPGLLKRLPVNSAIYEVFTAGDNDLAGLTLRFNAPNRFKDKGEPNNTLAQATRVKLPYSSIGGFTAIEPVGQDVDFFRVDLEAGQTFVAETVGLWQLTSHGLFSTGFDTLLGLFDGAGNRISLNDDKGDGSVLSKITAPIFTSGTYYLAVAAHGDMDFNGEGNAGGRYILNLATTSGALQIGLGDDDSVEVPLTFAFPFQGRSYTSVFVNANGNLTFGTGDFEYFPTVASFLAGPPRIAPIWVDMAPILGGSITVSYGVGTATVTFEGIPEWYSNHVSTFSVTLSSSGRIEIRYGATAGSIDGVRRLVGITPGGGVSDPGETDFSTASALSALGTTYEVFGFAEFDLDNRVLIFEP